MNRYLGMALLWPLYCASSYADMVITGTVTGPDYLPLQHIELQLFNQNGLAAGSAVTNSMGQWSISVYVPGHYYVKTAVEQLSDVANQVWSGIPCDGCAPSISGTAIVVESKDIHGINLHLRASPTAPIFSDSYEQIFWDSKLARLETNNRKIFYNGLNLAWQYFANDVGPNPARPDITHFEQVFQKLQAAGGNAMRLWIHTNGTYTPEWTGASVTGPGTDTIADLETILDMAHRYDIQIMLCLWSFDMMDKALAEEQIDRNRDILTLQSARQNYIDNALIPMATALKEHPAILAWEIFNEPEGMSKEFGWETNYRVYMSDIQAFANQAAGAIHRADPDTKVTNGSLGLISNTDVGQGNFNYYSDERLIAAGGDWHGTLDFYTTHYYDWAEMQGSPFSTPASKWQLDKPLVIAEFFPDCDYCGPDPHQSLYDNGYAGALSWSWTDRPEDTLLDPIVTTSSRHAGSIILNPNERPIVTLIEPQEGDILNFGEQVTISASADDPDGNIDSVSFYQGSAFLGTDTTQPYNWSLTLDAPGETSFYALAMDDDGNSARTPRRYHKVAFTIDPHRLEAEEADYSTLTQITDSAASAGAYVDMQGSGSITWTVPNISQSGEYYLIVGYNLFYDTPKKQFLSINGAGQSIVVFDGASKQWRQKVIKVDLTAGSNQIKFSPAWGWMYFDYIAVQPVTPTN